MKDKPTIAFAYRYNILYEALKEIAENPCLSPEGNAETAQEALDKCGLKYERLI